MLSGGGAAGLAYIGFFKALEELNLPKPDCIVGCSMGAIIGGLYASGKPVEEMEAIFEESFDVNRYVGGVHIPLFKHTLNQIIHYGTLITRMLSGTGADSGEKAHKFFLELSDCKSFDDSTKGSSSIQAMPIPFIFAFDFSRRSSGLMYIMILLH